MQDKSRICGISPVVEEKEEMDDQKKLVIVSARVHPGETNASWMMKGLLHYVTGQAEAAKVKLSKACFKQCS